MFLHSTTGYACRSFWGILLKHNKWVNHAKFSLLNLCCRCSLGQNHQQTTPCYLVVVQLWDNLNIWAAVHGGRGKGRFLRWFHARAPFADHTTSLSLTCKQSDLFLRPYITRGRGMTCFSRNIFCDLSQNLKSGQCFSPFTITLPRSLKYFADPSLIDHATHQSGSLAIHVVHCKLFHEPLGNV